MRSKLILIIVIFCVFILNAQEPSAYRIVTVGNGYDYECEIGRKALECLTRKCIDGLKRSEFISDDTEYDEETISKYIDSLHHSWNSRDLWRSTAFVFNELAEPLTYFRTFYDNSEDSIFFQLEVELEYVVGLLRLKRIDVITDNFRVLEKPDLRFQYDMDNGPWPNIPAPPPPPPPPRPDFIYKNVNLCQDYCQYAPIRIVRRKGYVLLDEKYVYRSLRRISNGYLVAEKKGKFGIIDEKNNTIVPIEYDSIKINFHQEYLVVYKGGKAGVLHQDNGLVIPVEYDQIIERRGKGSEDHTVFLFVRNNKYGVLNRSGDILIPAIYDELELFHGRFLTVKRDGYSGLIDINGEIIIPLAFEEVVFLSISLVKARKSRYWKVYDIEGTLIHNKEFGEIKLETTYGRDYKFFRITNKRGRENLYLLSRKGKQNKLIKVRRALE